MLYEALQYQNNPKPYLTQQFNLLISRKWRRKFQKHACDWSNIVKRINWLVVSTETGYNRACELKLYDQLPIVDIRVVTKPQKLVLGQLLETKGKSVGIIGLNNFSIELYKVL